MWPSLIAGGLGLIGSIFGSQQSADNTQAQIAASERQQSTQNQFQERMSNTAYQRASADMQNAGLNPAMMFGSGSAASSPAGSSIQAPMPQTRSAMQDLGSIASEAINSAVRVKTMDKMSDEIANLRATNDKIVAETATEKQKPALIGEETRDVRAAANLKTIHRGVAEQEALEAAAKSDVLDSPIGKKVFQGGYLGTSASKAMAPVTDILGSVANTALRKYGLDLLRDKMTGASAYRRGYSAGLEE